MWRKEDLGHRISPPPLRSNTPLFEERVTERGERRARGRERQAWEEASSGWARA